MVPQEEPLSDEALIAQYRAGDEASFNHLVARHLNSVYNLALHLGATASDAEDIAQDTFFKVWKHIKQYDAKHAQFRTWLMRIARNTVIDLLRKRKDISFSSFDSPEGDNTLTDTLPDELPLPDELLSAAFDTEALERVIHTLPPSIQEMLYLHYHEGLTFDEIGTLSGTSLHTVKSRHRRAVIAIRKLLGDTRRQN